MRRRRGSTGLTEEVVGLKEILANKQARGAFGQGRMEAIVRDGLPAGAYAFQPTLSNKTRPDCTIRLPGDRAAAGGRRQISAGGFLALRRRAQRRGARGRRAARVRTDVGKHVSDIAERYLLPGETQDIALMFVPSESIFADLSEHFDDVVQKAHRARVMIVSPSLLMMAIQVMRTIARDARMREQAHVIQAEVRGLLDDVRRLAERAAKLDDHFRLARKDVADSQDRDRPPARPRRADRCPRLRSCSGQRPRPAGALFRRRRIRAQSGSGGRPLASASSSSPMRSWPQNGSPSRM